MFNLQRQKNNTKLKKLIDRTFVKDCLNEQTCLTEGSILTMFQGPRFTAPSSSRVVSFSKLVDTPTLDPVATDLLNQKCSEASSPLDHPRIRVLLKLPTEYKAKFKVWSTVSTKWQLAKGQRVPTSRCRRRLAASCHCNYLNLFPIFLNCCQNKVSSRKRTEVHINWKKNRNSLWKQGRNMKYCNKWIAWSLSVVWQKAVW